MSEIDTSSEEFQAALKKALDAEASGLKSALDKERDARKAAEKAAAQFKEIDLEEYKELKTAAEKAEEERQREAGKFDELLDKNNKKWEGIVSDHKSKIESLTKSLESTLIESAAKTAISANGGDAELLLPHVTRSAKLVEMDGRHVAVVVDDRGEPRLAPDAKTASDYMGIDQLVSGWKQDGKYPGAFAGTGASGGGASGGSGGRPPSGSAKRISANDYKALAANEEAIRKGEVTVAFDG